MLKCNFGWATCSFLVPRARLQRAPPKAAPGVKQDHQCNIIGAFGEGCVLPPHCNRAGGAATAPPGIFYAFQFWASLATSCGPLLAPRVQQSLYFQGAQTGHRCQKRDLGLEVPAHRRNRKQRIYGWDGRRGISARNAELIQNLISIFVIYIF